jgi:hypothetical protein
MKYVDGTEARLGDRLKVSNGDLGVVVASKDTGEYSPEYPSEAWSEELNQGILVLTENGALVHFENVHSKLLSKLG